MSRNETLSGQKAREYRLKYGMDMPTAKLARILYKDNPLLYTTAETARTALRKLEGKTGAFNRKFTDDKSMFKEGERPKNPYNLPKSDEAVYEPFVIKESNVLVLSDIHIPYHSIEALTAAFDYAKKDKPDAILLNGDTIDFFGLSRFCKEPGKRSFADELKTFAEFFEILHRTFKCQVYFKLGNHEERYNHFLWQKAGEIADVNEFNLSEIIKARAEGIQVIGEKRIIKLGDLNVLHGHEFGGSVFSPVNIARGLFLRAKTSALQGHNHQTSEHTESDMNGKITTTFSSGCLCELHPAYLPINKWNHGMTRVRVDGMNFEVSNKRIHNGKIL
ncbi:MAG: vacuolar protein sorting 29 [Bacteriophage sp.]|nr:MAG: vacuolar protein sorting 29 [Bacteriophage sp.]